MDRHPHDDYAEWMTGLQASARELGQALQGGHITEQQLSEIVERAAHHYLLSFSRACHHPSPSPSLSPLERAFMWLGGIRPSLSFQLIYALTGHQIQAELEELLELAGAPYAAAAGQGSAASLASLSASQLSKLSELQTFTIQEEDRVEREMAKLQQSAADGPLIMQILATGSSSSSPTDDDIGRSQGGVDSAIRKKVGALQEMCMQANTLRLSTFSRVMDLLDSPLQKAQYLLGAAKLQVALREVGNTKCARRS